MVIVISCLSSDFSLTWRRLCSEKRIDKWVSDLLRIGIQSVFIITLKVPYCSPQYSYIYLMAYLSEIGWIFQRLHITMNTIMSVKFLTNKISLPIFVLFWSRRQLLQNFFVLERFHTIANTSRDILWFFLPIRARIKKSWSWYPNWKTRKD